MPQPAGPLLLALALAPALVTAAARAQGPVSPLLAKPAPRTAAPPGAALLAKAGPAVVRVLVEVQGPPAFAIERPGSGVVVDPGGLVLTLRSLVAEAIGAADKRVVVQLREPVDLQLPARIAAEHADAGLVLLELEAPPAELPFVQLGDSAGAVAGDAALVVGRPDQQGLVAFAGVVARSSTTATIDGRTLAAASVLLTDARIDHRCHGACLLDGSGRLLGLCSAEHVQRDVAEPALEDLQAPSFGFAIGVDRIRDAFATEFAKPGRAPTLARAAAGDPPLLPSYRAAVAAVRPAIVSVFAGDSALPPADPNDPYAKARRAGLGSGVLVTESGLLLTNHHLVADQPRILVTLADGRAFPANLVAADAGANLALLQLQLPAGTTVPCAATSDPQAVPLGAPVLGIGNPHAAEVTLSQGVLSQRRGVRLQADPDLGNHNAGGALVDGHGRLLGIVDGGRIDPIELAFRHLGEEAKTETNLSTCIGIDHARRRFTAELGARMTAGPPPADDGRAQPLAAAAASMLNVYVSWTSAAADEAANPFAAAKPPEVHGESLGSGVVIDQSGLLLSNWHVVDAATEPDGSMRRDHVVHVRTFDGRQLPATVLSISREEDLALLRLQQPADDPVPPVRLGDSEELAIGEPVYAIGNPHGFANTITAGIVAAKGQQIHVRGRWAPLERLLETDAAINAGNSGGALLDRDGRLVGINTAGSHGHDRRGFAIPVDHVREVALRLLLSPEKLRSPTFGLLAADDGVGPFVSALDPRGPAHRDGIEPGDRLLAIAGTPVASSVAFALQLLACAPGVAVPLRLRRGSEELTIEVAPLGAGAWAVLRQSGLELALLLLTEEPDAVRAAATAMHRAFRGDPAAEPPSLPTGLPRVVRVHDRAQQAGVEPGDLLLGVERTAAAAAGDAGGLLAFTALEQVRTCFDDPQRGSYDGATFRCWLYRNGEVRVVELQARRLLP